VKSESGELVWQPAGGGEVISAAEAGYAAPDPTVVAVKEGDGAGEAKAAASGDEAAAGEPSAAESETPASEAPAPEAAAEPEPAGEANDAAPAPATVPADGGDTVGSERGEDDSSR
jgi:hypothetical protein